MYSVCGCDGFVHRRVSMADSVAGTAPREHAAVSGPPRASRPSASWSGWSWLRGRAAACVRSPIAAAQAALPGRQRGPARPGPGSTVRCHRRAGREPAPRASRHRGAPRRLGRSPSRRPAVHRSIEEPRRSARPARSVSCGRGSTAGRRWSSTPTRGPTPTWPRSSPAGTASGSACSSRPIRPIRPVRSGSGRGWGWWRRCCRGPSVADLRAEPSGLYEVMWLAADRDGRLETVGHAGRVRRLRYSGRLPAGQPGGGGRRPAGRSSDPGADVADGARVDRLGGRAGARGRRDGAALRRLARGRGGGRASVLVGGDPGAGPDRQRRGRLSATGVASWPARSWPHAASMSVPRFWRTVALTPERRGAGRGTRGPVRACVPRVR